VRQDPATRAYMLTLHLATLGFRLLDARHLPDAGQRVLDRLAAETGEYCRLALVENGRLCWVAYAQGAMQGLRYDPPMSREIMLHATATGKAWLSTLPEVETFRLVYAQGFPVPAGVREDSLGSNVIRSIDALRAELAATRERGYALAEHEAEAGTVALAVTFRARADADAPTLGTISVAGPSIRFEDAERRSWLAARLHAAAAELSAIWPVWKRQRPASSRGGGETPRIAAVAAADR
jgi:DNA-binding IclR family transcriptional regulator